MLRSRAAIVALAAAVVFGAAPPAGAAFTQLGQTFAPVTSVGTGDTFLQTGSGQPPYTVPSPGVLTEWSYMAGTPGPATAKLKVARHVGGNVYGIVGESPPHSPVASQLNTYQDIRIPVQAGDVLGLYQTVGASNARSADPAIFKFHTMSGDPAPNTADTASGQFTGYQVDVAAVLEPDADNDGFGDETQDLCPFDPSTQALCGRTLTLDANKNKVKVGKKVRLSGDVVAPGAAAECAHGRLVEIRRSKKGGTPVPFDLFQADAQGHFSGKLTVVKTYQYSARIEGPRECAEATSNTEKVKVKKPK